MVIFLTHIILHDFSVALFKYLSSIQIYIWFHNFHYVSSEVKELSSSFPGSLTIEPILRVYYNDIL